MADVYMEGSPVREESAATTRGQTPAVHMPGETGTWVFIFVELFVFALLFGAFVYARSRNPHLFAASQRELNRTLGAVNTLFLLTSSLFVVTGIRAIRTRNERAPVLIALAMICGLGFLVVKAFEWHHQISAGHTVYHNHFFLYYYALTGWHLFHVLMGMCVLTFIWTQARKAATITPERMWFVEGGACYWHMVDLVWVVLFGLIYLMH
jgi:nitric oxide reductase NorE protein